MRTTVLLVALLALACPAAADERQATLESSLRYLRSVDEVAWVKFQRNSVFVGLRERPLDLRLLASAAATSGNIAMGFSCHVYFFDSSQSPTAMTDGSGAFCSASSRGGNITRNTCPGSVMR